MIDQLLSNKYVYRLDDLVCTWCFGSFTSWFSRTIFFFYRFV